MGSDPTGQPESTSARRRTVAKRIRRRHSARILSMWARIGVLLLFMFVGMAASIGLIIKVVHPYREVAENQQTLASIDQQISQLDDQNDELRQRIAYLKTRPGVITEARKLGYTKPGEIPIVVEGMPTTWSDPPPVNYSGTPGWRDKVSSFLHNLIGR